MVLVVLVMADVVCALLVVLVLVLLAVFVVFVCPVLVVVSMLAVVLGSRSFVCCLCRELCWFWCFWLVSFLLSVSVTVLVLLSL